MSLEEDKSKLLSIQLPLYDELDPLVPGKERRPKTEVFGLFLSLLSAVALSFATVFVKLSGPSLPFFYIVLAQGFGQFVFGFICCKAQRIHPFGQAKLLPVLIGRGLAGTVSLSLFFYGITLLPIENATVLRCAGPIFSAVLGKLFLGEPFGALDACASLFSLLGVTMVMQPDFIFGGDLTETPSHAFAREIGIACCLLSALIQAAVTIAVRRIGKRIHYLVFVNYLGIAGILLGLSGLVFSGQWAQTPSSLMDWVSLACVAIFSFAGQTLLNAGLQRAPAGPASLMRNVDVICAYIYGIIIFHEIPDHLAMGGAAMIMVCLIGMAISKWPKKKF